MIEQAYIFDFDGVLADTMPAHFGAYQQALKEFGVPIDEAQFYRQAGMTGREQIGYFAARAGVSLDVEAVYQRKRSIQSGVSAEVMPIASNLELLKLLRCAGYPVAIASGSSRESVLPVMRCLRIEADAVVTAEDVQRGKPHPDLFLVSAARLGVPADRCLVIEDSAVGVEAARAAGMKVFHFLDNRAANRPGEGSASASTITRPSGRVGTETTPPRRPVD